MRSGLNLSQFILQLILAAGGCCAFWLLRGQDIFQGFSIIWEDWSDTLQQSNVAHPSPFFPLVACARYAMGAVIDHYKSMKQLETTSLTQSMEKAAFIITILVGWNSRSPSIFSPFAIAVISRLIGTGIILPLAWAIRLFILDRQNKLNLHISSGRAYFAISMSLILIAILRIFFQDPIPFSLLAIEPLLLVCLAIPFWYSPIIVPFSITMWFIPLALSVEYWIAAWGEYKHFRMPLGVPRADYNLLVVNHLLGFYAAAFHADYGMVTYKRLNTRFSAEVSPPAEEGTTTKPSVLRSIGTSALLYLRIMLIGMAIGPGTYMMLRHYLLEGGTAELFLSIVARKQAAVAEAEVDPEKTIQESSDGEDDEDEETELLNTKAEPDLSPSAMV